VIGSRELKSPDLNLLPIAVALYDELLSLSPSPVIELNRAIAIGMRDGPDAGLVLVDDVAGRLPGFHLVPAAQADLLRRAGRLPEAEVRYREAIALAPTVEEQSQLQRRLDETGVAGTTPS